MKFKHTFHVFVDNFSITYKTLLYRLIVAALSFAMYFAVVYPFISELLDSEQFTTLVEGIKKFFELLISGHIDELNSINIRELAISAIELVKSRTESIVIGALVVICVHLLSRFLNGFANYGAAILVNDKMALHAKSHFLGSIISNFKGACLYNLIYVPLSLLFDLVCVIGFFFLFFFGLIFLPLAVKIFLFTGFLVAMTVLKMTFTTDWLPALITGKMGQKKAIAYTFSRKNKGTASVFSNFIVITLIVMGVNIFAGLFTLGVGLLITLPASYLLYLSFEFVNYYDREELKYFIDKNTVMKPAREKLPTREEFFRGE